jgi:hypothetical protein
MKTRLQVGGDIEHNGYGVGGFPYEFLYTQRIKMGVHILGLQK